MRNLFLHEQEEPECGLSEIIGWGHGKSWGVASGNPGSTCRTGWFNPLSQGPGSQEADPPTGGNLGSGPQAPAGSHGQVAPLLPSDLCSGSLVHALVTSTSPYW